MREEQQPPDQEVVEIAKNIRRLQLPMSMPRLGHVNCYIPVSYTHLRAHET